MTAQLREIFTIGHSNLSLEEFLGLLRAQRIEVLVDVRSVPHGGYARHFDKEELAPALKAGGVRYLFMGEQLGGRPNDAHLYSERRARNGKIERYCDYDKVRDWPPFRDGVSRLREGARTYRIAVMCAERDPLNCHRGLLIAEVLRARGGRILHLIEKDRVEDHEQTRWRAVPEKKRDELRRLPGTNRESLIAQFLRAQAVEVAHREAGASSTEADQQGTLFR